MPRLAFPEQRPRLTVDSAGEYRSDIEPARAIRDPDADAQCCAAPGRRDESGSGPRAGAVPQKIPVGAIHVERRCTARTKEHTRKRSRSQLSLHDAPCANRYGTMRDVLDLEARPPLHTANPLRDIGERERLYELTSGFAVEARREMQLQGLTSCERRRTDA